MRRILQVGSTQNDDLFRKKFGIKCTKIKAQICSDVLRELQLFDANFSEERECVKSCSLKQQVCGKPRVAYATRLTRVQAGCWPVKDFFTSISRA